MIVKQQSVIPIRKLLPALLVITFVAISPSTIAKIPHPHKTPKASKTTTQKQRPKQQPYSKKKISYSDQQIADILNWVSSKTSPCNLCGGYYKQPPMVLKYSTTLTPSQLPTRITSRGPALFVQNGESILRKDVVITQPGRIVKADKAEIFRNSKTGKYERIVLIGHVRVIEADKLLVTPYADINLTNNAIKLGQTFYHIYQSSNQNDTSPSTSDHHPNHDNVKKQLKGYDAWGSATHAERLANGILKFWGATYSTCPPLNPSWILKAARLVINKKKNIGKAYNTSIKFKHVPVFYSPYLSFRLNKKRKTGFLSPIFGVSSSNAYQITIPFYWNIAPNYDALFKARYMSKRGVLASALFRYLTLHNIGQLYLSFIPGDRGFRKFKKDQANLYTGTTFNDIAQPYLNELSKDNINRGFFSYTNYTIFNQYWSSEIHLNYVTDDYYFKDFGNNFNTITANQLLNEFNIKYSGSHWTIAGLVQAYQTLHLIDQISTSTTDQYSRLPELDASGDYPNLFAGINLELGIQAVNFDYHSDFPPFTFQQPIGQRYHVRPSFNRPFYWASGYITPEFALDSTTYDTQLPTAEAGLPRADFSASRTLPIFDVDSGLYFQRYVELGHHKYIQTFEPRVFYLYVPFQNQLKYPNYDTWLTPFTYEQLFTMNRFTGYDRIENANQISLSLSSSLLDAENDAKKISVDVGFIYYFQTPRVQINPSFEMANLISSTISEDNQHISPIVGEVTYYPWPNWNLSGNAAWDTHLDQVNNAGATINYHKSRYTATFGYQFVHASPDNPVDNLGFSNNTDLIRTGVSWSLGYHWSTMAYFYYNISREHAESYYGGVAYSNCCFALRFIVARNWTGVTINNASSVKNQYDTNFYIQFQLKGLGTVGNNSPSNLLASTLPDYEDPFRANYW